MDPETNFDGIRNVGIKDGIIGLITEKDIKGKETIDATGHAVVPGFIDVHSHSDAYLLIEPTAASKLYQGVTLGALSFPTDSTGKLIRGRKRHPTIEDRVVIYANATILGGQTVIGHDSVIGGNVWLTKSVLPYSRVMYKSQDSSESGLDWTI